MLREVAMEPGGERGLAVIAENPAVTGVVMRINLSSAASTAALRVQVAGSRPVADHGQVRYALQLELLPDATSAHAAQRRRLGSRVGSRKASSEGQLRTLLAAADLVGVLQRDIDARTLNVSGSGCLLETASPVDEGTVAQLRMRIGGVEYPGRRSRHQVQPRGRGRSHAPRRRRVRVDDAARRQVVAAQGADGAAAREGHGRHARHEASCQLTPFCEIAECLPGCAAGGEGPLFTLCDARD